MTVTGKRRATKKKAARTKTQQGQENMTQMYDYGEPEQIRKITNKTVMGKDFLNSGKPSEPTTLYTLFGVIYGYDEGKSEYGSYLKFRGDFMAFNHVDEKAFQAPFAIIPVPMDAILAGQYQSAKNAMADPETGELPMGKQAKFKFVCDIGYKPSDTPTGYEWTVKSRVKMQQSDEMRALQQELIGIEMQEPVEAE